MGRKNECVASIRYGAVFLVILYFVMVQWTRGVYILEIRHFNDKSDSLIGTNFQFLFLSFIRFM